MDVNIVQKMINEIDWTQYGTAYGNASGTEPVRDFTIKEKIISLFIYNEYRKYKYNKYKCYHVNIPQKLINLFSDNIKIAIDAASKLGSALCHQRIMVSNAALPAYDIIIIRLKEFELIKDDGLIEELLNIFYGFTICTNEININDEWVKELRYKLKSDLELFRKFTVSDNECISYFAVEICEFLSK